MAKRVATKGRGVGAVITQRLVALHEDLHIAYCAATCIDSALSQNDVDLDPEIAVCTYKFLVLELDRTHFEVKEVNELLARLSARKGESKAPGGRKRSRSGA